MWDLGSIAAELVWAKKKNRLIVMIATDNKVFWIWKFWIWILRQVPFQQHKQLQQFGGRVLESKAWSVGEIMSC